MKTFQQFVYLIHDNINLSDRPEVFEGIFDMETLQATKDLDACIVGVPVDGATSNRPGTRSTSDDLASSQAITYTYCILTK